jgi:cob(I)alamin adenosyltransferase
VIQFIKGAEVGTGEYFAAQQLGIEWHRCGDGFVFSAEAVQSSAAAARDGWRLAQEKIAAQAYDLVILDEFTYLLNFGWLDGAEVVDWLKANKPADLHLILTGRNASPEIIAYADLVTEMREVKHPYRQQKIAAQIGIEY